MSAAEQRKLDLYRLDGDTISAGCHACPLLRDCGGYTSRGGGWSCMDRCQNCDRSKCDLVCMKKPADFARALLEVGGLRSTSIGKLKKRESNDSPPKYVPVLQHGIDSTMPLEWAAIPLRSLMRKIRGVYRPLAKSPAELRTRFGLHATTKIILLGIGKDPPIETYWRWRRFHAAPDALAQLDLYCAIAPNYSLFLNEPRTQHLFNRKRSLICASEFSGAGIPPIPYLHTITPADWKFWETFLKEHGEVDSIAEEFQTGLARPERGLDAIASLARLQDSLRRPLHLMAVGGASYGSLISAHFDRFTIIDSVPFMKAVKRRRATPGVRGIKWAQALGEDVGDLAFHNSRRYAEWIASMIKTSSQARPRHLGSARRDSPDSAKPV